MGASVAGVVRQPQALHRQVITVVFRADDILADDRLPQLLP
jgi:hypothetical protein